MRSGTRSAVRSTSGQIHLLPALSDYLAYIVLTPFIGADAAAEVVIEDEAALAADTRIAS